jgi:phosphatidylinositol alpha-mannosyltransferase
MVLTEAFAAGTTVVASDIAGYRDVVTGCVDGVLVPPGDAQALAEALREMYHEPTRRRALAQNAAKNVRRFAWERVALEVMEAYSDAIAMPDPVGTRQTLAVHARVSSARCLLRNNAAACSRSFAVSRRSSSHWARSRSPTRLCSRSGSRASATL